MNKDNPNLVDHLREDTQCTNEPTETKEQFRRPNLKKPTVTRAGRFEQFLWHEFYEEYIRSKQRLEAIRPGTPTTEYYEKYSKLHSGKEMNPQNEELINKYPLYATNAVTLWNPTGDFSCNFKRAMNVTTPTQLQPGKFDEKNLFK